MNGGNGKVGLEIRLSIRKEMGTKLSRRGGKGIKRGEVDWGSFFGSFLEEEFRIIFIIRGYAGIVGS